MSLYFIVSNVTITIFSSIATWLSAFFAPQYFEMFALVATASVLIGTIYILVSYLSILYSVSYLK